MYHLPSSRASVLIFAINIAAPGRHVKGYRAAEEMSDRSPIASEAADLGRKCARREGATGPRQTGRKITSQRYRTSMRAGLLGFRDCAGALRALAYRPTPTFPGNLSGLAGQVRRKRPVGAVP